jgi:predicted DNA-binding protein
MTTKTVKNDSKIVGLRLPVELYNYISLQAKDQDRSLSNYIKKVLTDHIDETDYLLSTKENKELMYKAKKDIETNNSKPRKLV